MFEPKTPFLATDAIVECYQGDRFKGIVLIERKMPPYGFALPGGFVERGESVEDALKREMKEEIGMDIEILSLLGVYSEPDRDARFHTASVVYVARAQGEPKAGDDAKAAHILPIETIKNVNLCFDHALIFEEYIRLKSKH